MVPSFHAYGARAKQFEANLALSVPPQTEVNRKKNRLISCKNSK
ncbi:hypothetical protein HMPREF0574_1244 [Mobiluncus curtisii subsp. curtisii ATCC 35241]|uniref:Uncharacterized protein n=1 Tax=Mobiluncus curtisii (strain ATCC 43063 / DSM 2711 / V125) TaxID=548479 RepID=D6ZJT1_MOBCV|nr:hypothetical protein HMPREF0573_10661 [Mobiluncus curtisii ATCC 43063]EFL93514.1 hypothetical protein HMPREF0574_1244 [Mobiluncus curtisii subsp. curtisii ATCC 35241]